MTSNAGIYRTAPKRKVVSADDSVRSALVAGQLALFAVITRSLQTLRASPQHRLVSYLNRLALLTLAGTIPAYYQAAAVHGNQRRKALKT